MASCYGCPYRWHDEDCEYCSMKGDEVIDLKNYSKETCSYYKAYQASRGGSSSASSSSSSSSYSSSSGSDGCIGGAIIIFIIIGAIIAGITFIPGLFSGEKKSENKPAAVSSEQKTAVIYNVNNSLRMRQSADSSSAVITTIPKGETVTIIEEGAEWCRVQYGEYEGYCATECLDIQ